MAGTGADAVLRARALAALAAVPLATAALLTVVAPLLGPLTPGGADVVDADPSTLADLLALTCALVLVAGWAWLALGTSACLLGHVLRPAEGGARPLPGTDVPRWLRPATARRLAAVLVGSSLGTLAVAPAGAHRPVDLTPPGTVLPVPARPVDGRPPEAGPRSPRVAPAATVVVRPGDTLWALAAGHAWRRLHAANRGVIGPDPDLIHPGTRLVLPAPASTEGLP